MSVGKRFWMERSPRDGSMRSERRHFMKQAAAAGLVARASTFPAIAQDMVGQRSSADASSHVSLGVTLARYAAALKYEDLPDDVIRIAKRTLLDTFGCAFGGYTAGPSKIAIKLAGDVSSKQGATVLLSGVKTSPE